MIDVEMISHTIAEGMAVLGFPQELAWEPAKQCPQGHANDDMPVNQGIGELCRTCEARWVLLEPDGTAGRAGEVRIRDRELFEHRRDVDWHPEFRIQPVPRDFTKSDVLLAAVDAICDKYDLSWAWKRWRVATMRYQAFLDGAPESAYWCSWSDVKEEALADALAQAVTAVQRWTDLGQFQVWKWEESKRLLSSPVEELSICYPTIYTIYWTTNI